MSTFQPVVSEKTAAEAVYDRIIPAGEGWIHDLLPGQVLRIIDVEGNQAVDTLFYSTEDPSDHYSAVRTITRQHNLYRFLSPNRDGSC